MEDMRVENVPTKLKISKAKRMKELPERRRGDIDVSSESPLLE